MKSNYNGRGKKLVKAFIAIAFLLLLLAPLVFIYAITAVEMRQFDRVAVPPLTEKAYGEPLPVLRTDLRESVTVSGKFISSRKFFMELPKLKDPYETRMLVSFGDVIQEGDIIGYQADGITKITASASGIVRDVHLGQRSYLLLESTQDLVLSCYVNESVLSMLKRDGLELTNAAGEPVELPYVGQIVDGNGDTEIRLLLSGGVYGASKKSLRLYTGKVYTQALVVPTACLFKIPEDETKWYVRVLDSQRNVVGIQAVQVGYSDGEFTCVTGLEEGTLLDSGYARIAGGK